MNAPLPFHRGHSRAVAMLLEALSAWYRLPLHVALDGTAPDVVAFPDHGSLWLGDLSSLVIPIEWVDRRPTHRQTRDKFRSHLVRSGVGVEAARAVAGHSMIAVTNRYVHPTGIELRDAVTKLGMGGGQQGATAQGAFKSPHL